jgi:hypothetical protein
MNPTWKRRLAVTAFALCTAFPSSAQQSLYRETEDGWFIYVEDRSCVMYADFGEGRQEITLRFSNRVDENRVYFTAYGRYFEPARDYIGELILLGIGFDDENRFLGAAGMVIRQPDGVMGVTGSDYEPSELFRLMSTRRTLRIQIRPNGASGPQSRAFRDTVNIGPFQLPGAAVAVMHLEECTARNFGRHP